MGQFSTYLQNKIIDHILKVATFTQPTHLYVGLSTADPLEDGSGLDEPSDAAYVRQVCDDWYEANLRGTQNAVELDFPAATDSWGTITHWAIFDAITSGNMLAFGEITDPKNVITGITLSIHVGDIDVSITTGEISTYLANAILDHIFMNDAYTVPTHIYVALTTETVFDSDSGATITEPGDVYARVQFDTWNIAAEGISSNDGDIVFADPGASWGIITGVALLDALTEGNLLLFDDVTESQEVNAGDDPVEFGDESLNIGLI